MLLLSSFGGHPIQTAGIPHLWQTSIHLGRDRDAQHEAPEKAPSGTPRTSQRQEGSKREARAETAFGSEVDDGRGKGERMARGQGQAKAMSATL